MKSTTAFGEFTGRLRSWMRAVLSETAADRCSDELFNEHALELFALQYKHNSVLRRFCDSRNVSPGKLRTWQEIPALPAAAFKEFETTCLSPNERVAVFLSSGTTAQARSRHFHSSQSLEIYAESLWPWFSFHLLENLHGSVPPSSRLAILSPGPHEAPHSSLVHMFEVIRQRIGAPQTAFLGRLQGEDWTFDPSRVVEDLVAAGAPVLLLGTAFSFVHLLDWMAVRQLKLKLPQGSRVMETGGYKGRSRSVPRAELHAMLAERFGLTSAQIISEYGMSELSSQAYDARFAQASTNLASGRKFRFPPWVRIQILSPETGQEATLGEPGLLRIYDLANVFSTMAIQTEDVAIGGEDGFELLGRVPNAEPRGCSLMSLSNP